MKPDEDDRPHNLVYRVSYNGKVRWVPVARFADREAALKAAPDGVKDCDKRYKK